MWDIHNLHFSMLFVMRYFSLAISKCFRGEFFYQRSIFISSRSFFFHQFWKSLNLFWKDLCNEVLKIENLRCTFFSFFHVDRHEIFFISHIQMFLVEKWPRKWAIFIFFIISRFSKISQHVLQISLWWSFKNKKSEMYNFFVFLCWLSWDDFDMPYFTAFGGKIT